LFPIPSALPDTFPTCATTDTVSPATNIASSFFPPPTALPVLPAYAALVAYAIIPILSAALIAVSRIIDYWHHADDVLAGSVLGCACAGVAFLVMDNQCDKYK
jgi:membrane-associated phospholipid phosphatase